MRVPLVNMETGEGKDVVVENTDDEDEAAAAALDEVGEGWAVSSTFRD